MSRRLSAAARRRASARLAEALTQLCGLMVVAIVLLMLADMVGRNLLGLVLPSTAEATVLILAYMVFIGSAVAVQRSMHFLIFEPRARYPAWVLPLLDIAVRGVIVVFSLATAFYGFRLAMLQMGQLSAALQIPYGLFYLALPVGGVLTAVFAVLEPLDRAEQPRHEVLM